MAMLIVTEGSMWLSTTNKLVEGGYSFSNYNLHDGA